MVKDFNPRSHEESDKYHQVTPHPNKKISIHALTKRATEESSMGCQMLSHFNPRSHEESDLMHLLKC